jgi:hypothetical protein
MTNLQPRRISRELTAEERRRLEDQQQQIAAELPDLAARDQMRKEAREETTLSGELRRAVHSSHLSLATIAERIGIEPLLLDDFLTGDRTLRSDVMDRLAIVLEFQLQRVLEWSERVTCMFTRLRFGLVFHGWISQKWRCPTRR